MRYKRSVRLKGKKKKRSLMEIDITSLLDIIVTLLIFLLQSYNTSGVIINVPKGVKLPISKSTDMNTTGVIVQVSADTIWVDDKEIQKLSNEDYSKPNALLVPLFNELERKKQEVKQLELQVHSAQKFTGMINIVVDKGLHYGFIKKILHTSAEAGFMKYKFVVLGEEN